MIAPEIRTDNAASVAEIAFFTTALGVRLADAGDAANANVMPPIARVPTISRVGETRMLLGPFIALVARCSVQGATFSFMFR